MSFSRNLAAIAVGFALCGAATAQEQPKVAAHVLERAGFAACLSYPTNREAFACIGKVAAAASRAFDPQGSPVWLEAEEEPIPWECVPGFHQCGCHGTDDCVDLILFGPCTGPLRCTFLGSDDCACDY